VGVNRVFNSVVGSAKLTICPQCGESFGPLNREFCRRCGSPALRLGINYDPFKVLPATRAIRVDRRTKLIVRSGIFGIGIVSFLTGLLLCYGGWADPQGMDLIQLWISRLGGPVLLLQGILYLWLPFRKRPVRLAPVIMLRP
jgi:hypothetical protein